MEWAQTPWYVFLISAILMPSITEVLKRWQVAQQAKTLVAFVVSCAVAVIGLLIDGKLTWSTLIPNLSMVFMTGTIVYRVFFPRGEGGSTVVKTLTKVIAPLLLVSLLMLAGCNTTPATPEDRGMLNDATTIPEGGKSGKSSAENTTTDLPFAPAVAWGASDADSNATAARYSPTSTNSGTGHVVTGFVQGLTSQQRKDMEATVIKFISEDPVLKSIADELKWLMDQEEYDEAWQARADALRKAYAEARDSLMVKLDSAGITESLNLGSLKQIVIVAFVNSHVGATERAPSEAEVNALAKLLPDIVSAARGEETIQNE
jgi:hypothetical protein